MDTVQETIIFLTWTIREWYLLTELFQITVINCKLALVFSLENPVFLSGFQLSQPFLSLFNLSTNSMSSWSLFSLDFAFCAIVVLSRLLYQSSGMESCRENSLLLRHLSLLFAVVGWVPVAHSHMEKDFGGTAVCIRRVPQAYSN